MKYRVGDDVKIGEACEDAFQISAKRESQPAQTIRAEREVSSTVDGCLGNDRDFSLFAAK